MTDTRTHPWPVATVTMEPYNQHHQSGRTNVFLQWKGTDVCFDYYCECGEQGHFDGYFAHKIQCGTCGRIYELPATIYPAPLDAESYPHEPVIVDMRDEDMPPEPAEDTARLMQRVAVVLDSEEATRLGLNMIGFGTRDGHMVGHVQRNLLGNYDGAVMADPNTIIDLGPIRHPETDR